MSTSSIVQDMNLVKEFHKTPGAPVKMANHSPRTSSRKRSLFQPSSPTNSEDLGPMSPLSISSSSNSCPSPDSPCFSPNGKFSTPPKTPVHGGSMDQGKFSGRKMEIMSSLFPNLKVPTPKSQRNQNTPKRQPLRVSPRKSSKEARNITADDILRDLTTPPKSSKKSGKINKLLESEDEDGASTSTTTPRRGRSMIETSSMSRFGIHTISSDSFYGPVPQPPKARTQLFIDTLGSRVENRKRARSLSLDSVTSNRSFVSGSGQNKKKKTSGTREHKSRSGSKRGSHKGPHIGVWHGIKKPKKMKFSKTSKNKHFVSPNTRISKMTAAESSNQIQVKPKGLFEEKPRRRTAHRKKSNNDSFDENEILDSFPHNLIKRKKLPSVSHPSNVVDMETENLSPDPNKKFMKYGSRRRAVFTLNENLKLQYTDGVMKLQSPKKRRKLYSGKNDVIFDFCDDDDRNSAVKENIENILSKLSDDSTADAENGRLSSNADKVEQISEAQLIKILDDSATKVNLVPATPSKVLTQIQIDPNNKLISNLSSLAINKPDDDNERIEMSSNGKSNRSELSLGKTGSILSCARNILTNADMTVDTYPLSDNEDSENVKPSEKFFSVFYKENWNKSPSNKDSSLKNSAKKKAIKVPDDQYLIDAGQKSIGIVTCPKCGVMYQAGDFADEATHRNFHHHLPELRFTGWTNERVVGRYLDGHIIMILSVDPKAWWYKVTKIVDIVDQELGFPEGSVNALFYKTVYLFINDKAKQIVGCLIAEECKEAYKMFPPLEGVDVDSCSKDPSPCKVGISRIWTALNHRRRGVAKRMIECLQKTFIFGEVIPMDLVAFSVPSPSGKLLAQNVTGKLDFLVYGFM